MKSFIARVLLGSLILNNSIMLLMVTFFTPYKYDWDPAIMMVSVDMVAAISFLIVIALIINLIIWPIAYASIKSRPLNAINACLVIGLVAVGIIKWFPHYQG